MLNRTLQLEIRIDEKKLRIGSVDLKTFDMKPSDRNNEPWLSIRYCGSIKDETLKTLPIT